MTILNFDHAERVAYPEDTVITNHWMENVFAVADFAMPYNTPYALKIVGANLCLASGGSFVAEVYVGSGIKSTPNPAEAALTISGIGFFNTDISLNGQENIAVYYRHTSGINRYPSVELFFKKTAEETTE